MKHFIILKYFLFVSFYLSAGGIGAHGADYISVSERRVLVNDSVCYLVKKKVGQKDKNPWIPYCGIIDKLYYENAEYALLVDSFDVKSDTMHIIRTVSSLVRPFQRQNIIEAGQNRNHILEEELKKVEECGNIVGNVTVSGRHEGCDYVDLGLPDGTLWATCNVGAGKPTDNGKCFTYKEIDPEGVNTELYRKSSIARECSYFIADPSLEKNIWQMPTIRDQKLLVEGCFWRVVGDFDGSGRCGLLGISKTNGNGIFFPANDNNVGVYWSNTVKEIGLNARLPMVFVFKERLCRELPFEHVAALIRDDTAYSVRQILKR